MTCTCMHLMTCMSVSSLAALSFFMLILQEAGDADDSHMVACAKSLADASTQRLQLTVLDSRRDVSALAAQSAIQVRAMVFPCCSTARSTTADLVLPRLVQEILVDLALHHVFHLSWQFNRKFYVLYIWIIASGMLSSLSLKPHK